MGLHALGVLPVLQHRAERRVHRPLVERRATQGREGHRPVDGLGDAGRLVQAEAAHRFHGRRDLTSQRLGHVGCPQSHDRDLALEVGMIDPVVEATSLECVVDVAGAVRRDHHERRHRSAKRAELGDRDRVVGQDLEEEGLELVVRPVDFVDEQHGRRTLSVVDRLQERAAHEEALGVELVLERIGRGVRADLAGGFCGAQVQELPGVVPLVDGLGDVETLVALQAHELAARPPGQHLGNLGLADPRLAFQQERAMEGLGQEHRRGEAFVSQVLVRGERGAHVLDCLGRRCHRLQRRLSATFRGNGGEQWTSD